MRRVRATSALFALAVLGLTSAGAGCCAIQKAPGRCVACAYDNCVIPYGSRAAGDRAALPSAPSLVESSAPGTRGGAAAMAY